MNTITHLHINSLKADQLTELLLMLLHLEYKKYSLPDCYISVPQNITTADGGEDGRIETTDFKESRWIKDNICLFQSKATKMSDSDCKKEMLKKKKKKNEKSELKFQIKEVLDKNGTYILFTTDTFVEGAKNETSLRIYAIREGIKLAEGDKYANAAKIQIYDSNLISNWTNEYISAVSFVQTCHQITRPNGMLIWKDWKSYQENSTNYKYNDQISGIINDIRYRVYNKKNIRIEGVSGIGKSRLLCEVFSPGERDDKGRFDELRKSLSDSVIYFDLATGNSREILDFIKSSRQHSAILVLDNCEPSLHETFLREVLRSGSLQNLISVDYEELNNKIVDSELIRLDGQIFMTVVEDILKDEYGQVLNNHDLRYLIDFSDGNPKMAIQFVKASLKNLNLNETLNNDLIKKLIFGRNEINEEEFKVLKVISAYKYIEFPDDSYYSIDSDRYEILLEHAKFFSNFFNIAYDNIRLIIKKYLKKGVLERRGNKLIIRPNPLSLKLSLIFWDELPPEKYLKFIEECPMTLRTPLVEQLGQLGEAERAKDLVKQAWGINGNFSTAEILNSNMGSRLFRSIVSVNPLETVRVLEKNYLDKPKEYLLEIKDGRQNIVWSLEKLCFRKETFNAAAKILMCFAMAENQFYYSNNATDYFTQLFRIFLAGTEVEYTPRIKILEWALKKNDKNFNKIIIRSCERALTPTYNLSKMLGAEQQGGLRTLVDYQPTSADEINIYRENILKILFDFANFENEFQEEAQNLIFLNIHDLFEFNFPIEKLKIILDILSDKTINKEILKKGLYNSINYGNLHVEQKEFILHYINKFQAHTIEERIRDNVSEPKIIIRTSEDEDNYEQKGRQLARKLAEEVIAEKIDMVKYLPNLLTGIQYNAYDFGVRIGELIGYDKLLLDNIIEYLDTLTEYQNISFALGYASTFSKEEINNLFILLLDRKSLFAFNLFQFKEQNLEDALKLINIIDQKNLSIDSLVVIKRQVVLLADDEIIKYFKRIEDYENGLNVIFETLFTLIYRNEADNISDKILNYLKAITQKNNLLKEIDFKNSMDYHEWELLMIHLINKFEKEITRTITQNIVDYFLNDFSFRRSDYHIANVANEILNHDFFNSWKIFGQLLEDNVIAFWQIFNMSYITDTSSKHQFFVNAERNANLLEWLKQNPDKASKIVRVAPLFDSVSEPQWFPFTKDLIINFGDDDHFLSELSSNLYSMFTSGSRVPYLNARKKLIEVFKEDENEKIKNWAIEQIEYYDNEIIKEQIEDAEGFLGK